MRPSALFSRSLTVVAAITLVAALWVPLVHDRHSLVFGDARAQSVWQISHVAALVVTLGILVVVACAAVTITRVGRLLAIAGGVLVAGCAFTFAYNRTRSPIVIFHPYGLACLAVGGVSLVGIGIQKREPTFTLRSALGFVACCAVLLWAITVEARIQQERIETLDRTGEETVCPVHQQNLLPEKQLAIWHILYDLEYYEACEKIFPYSNGPRSTYSYHRWVLVRYCPECRRLEREWGERTDAKAE